MITKRPARIRLGGGIQRFKSRSLREAFSLCGFAPEEEGSEWVLLASDLHFYHNGAVAVADALDYRVSAQLAALAAMPPAACLLLGDQATGLCGSFGSALDATDGANELAAADAALAAFSSLAPTYTILGNHDTYPNESPLGAFHGAHLPVHDTGLNSTLTIGGVRFVLLSASHDAAFVDGQDTYLQAALEALDGSQECVLCVHQPSGGRACDWHAMQTLHTVVPTDLPNPLWWVCGHDHRFGDSAISVNGATVAKWQIGTASGPWQSFSDGTHPAMAAMACRGGAVVGRFAWGGREQFWHHIPTANRATATPLAAQFDGLAGETVLASYVEGSYDRTGHFAEEPHPTRYKVAGTWLAMCYDLQINFPIPAGATKFWGIVTIAPTTALSMSADGSDWQAITPIPTPVSNALIVTIPDGLRSAENLHVRLQGGGFHASAWGFA